MNLVAKEKLLKGNKGRIKGNKIAISKSITTSVEKRCILAEELGHFKTSCGDITDQTNTNSKKQEEIARLWAYDKLVGLRGIVNAFEYGCLNFHEMAEFLDVTEEFLRDTIEKYKSKYGICTTLDDYIIYFTPMFGVMKKNNKGNETL